MDKDNILESIAGKYLLFTLGKESYGVGVLKVKEIIKLLPITPVIEMLPYMKGVVNLRGKVIPVIDLREKFNITHSDNTDRTCIIVIMLQSSLMGVIVDGVEEVANIKLKDLEASPDFGQRLSVDYILGIAKLKNGIKTLLDIDKATIPS